MFLYTDGFNLANNISPTSAYFWQIFQAILAKFIINLWDFNMIKQKITKWNKSL